MALQKILSKPHGLSGYSAGALTDPKADPAALKEAAMGRFGLGRVIREMQDMTATISKPEGQIKLWEADFARISERIGTYWNALYKDLVATGDKAEYRLTPDEAKEVADKMAIRMMKNDFALLKIKYPYSFRKGADPTKDLLSAGGAEKAIRNAHAITKAVDTYV